MSWGRWTRRGRGRSGKSQRQHESLVTDPSSRFEEWWREQDEAGYLYFAESKGWVWRGLTDESPVFRTKVNPEAAFFISKKQRDRMREIADDRQFF